MWRIIKLLCLLISFQCAVMQHACAQFGIGVAYGVDLYQFQHNPKLTTDSIKFGQGSAIFNMNIGPKLFFGGKNVAGSVEALVGMAPFSLDIDEVKGLGAFYFPLMATINFKGLTTFNDEPVWGFGLAGGMQFTRTDLYFRQDEFAEIKRELFQTAFAQINIGLGNKDSVVYGYFRYGSGDNDASNFHVGIMLSQNLTKRSRLKRSKKNETHSVK